MRVYLRLYGKVNVYFVVYCLPVSNKVERRRSVAMNRLTAIQKELVTGARAASHVATERYKLSSIKTLAWIDLALTWRSRK